MFGGGGGHRLGALERGGGGTSPPFQCIPGAAAPLACSEAQGGIWSLRTTGVGQGSQWSTTHWQPVNTQVLADTVEAVTTDGVTTCQWLQQYRECLVAVNNTMQLEGGVGGSIEQVQCKLRRCSPQPLPCCCVFSGYRSETTVLREQESRERGGGGGGEQIRDALEGEGVRPPPPPGRPAYARLLSL